MVNQTFIVICQVITKLTIIWFVHTAKVYSCPDLINQFFCVSNLYLDRE